MPVNARETALDALRAYDKRGARPDMLLADSELDARDAALATNIVNGVLQNRMLLDCIIEKESGRKKAYFEPEVLEILRIGAYQLIFLTRTPTHAIVSEAVELTKKRSRWASGIVNAVLRKIKREIPDISETDFIKWLSITYSHPEWLVQELADEYGEAACEAVLRADNEAAPTVCFINPLYKTPLELSNAEKHPFLEDAFLISGQVSGLDAFQKGAFYVQDPAAHMAVMAAKPRPGYSVLDACAAPGGKSFAAAMMMENLGRILSCDIHEKKLRLIEAGAKRLGIDIISTMARDARKPLDDKFDLVLADVPCSGIGVIRKKPEIRYKAPEELERLPEIQLDILRSASKSVKRGGTLLYSTCTILRRENEDVVNAFLAGNSDFTFEPFTLPGPFGECPGYRTILQGEAGTDGFFICKLRKR